MMSNPQESVPTQESGKRKRDAGNDWFFQVSLCLSGE